ncbi:HNH endonuclease signature motif containing protein [Burkholderia gladioli]|uniref:HNH endonuclease signature motif containing protein n=1 Tax=Burkholderia gladioli TaxID=28095 RepID=UPI001C254B8C|nr:HNH endonuclease signature motif containing protein [Burkholderia gladioli]MBU9378733.1 HNH endonuclease [Burkholderia gladioli]
MSPQRQMPLELAGGHHVGPLFVPVKRRAPLITSGLMAGKRRRARERRATPRWLSPVQRELIAVIYTYAETLTRGTGELHVVDHIVPLDGKLVCGLHVPWNLRATHWLENARKGWHTWPGMPFEQLELL